VRTDSQLRLCASACDSFARQAQAEPLSQAAAALQTDWPLHQHKRRHTAAQAVMLKAVRRCQHVQTHSDTPRAAGPAAEQVMCFKPPNLEM